MDIKAATEMAKNEERFLQEFSHPAAKDFYNGVIKQANRMTKNLRALKKRIKKNDFERTEFFNPSTAADGLPDALVNNYTKLISEYNRLN